MVTHVGDSASVSGTGSTLTVSYGSTAGNTLVVSAEGYMSGNTPVTLSSVMDSAGNHWTVKPGAGSYDAGSGVYGYATVAYCENAAAVTSVTLTWNTAITRIGFGQVSEFTGLPAGSGTDGYSATAESGSFTSFTTPAITTAGASDVLVAVTAVGAAWTGVSPGTELSNGQSAWNIVPPGSQSFTFTAGSDNLVLAVAVLGIGYTGADTITVTNPGSQSAIVNAMVRLQMAATDSQGGQTLTWSASGLPPGLGINGSSGLIVGNPSAAGTYSVTVTATDTTNSSGSATFTWTITLGGTTSRTIVRTGVARYFGGTTYDSTFRAYRGGPLLTYGLSTVRAYQAKRVPDTDYVMGLSPGRGMGALMVLEMPETRNTFLTLGTLPAASGGQRHLVYPVRCHVFHMAHEAYAEDAEADVDSLIQAIEEQIYADPTLGGVCYQAGLDSAGIRVKVDPSENWKEITVTHFLVTFNAEVQIVV